MTINYTLPDKEFVIDNAVPITDGLAVTMSAFVQFSPECQKEFVLWFYRLHAQGYIKIKTARVAPRRDWIRP